MEIDRLFGRDEDIARLVERMDPRHKRAGWPVAIVGYGGVGKSSLARVVSARLIANGTCPFSVWLDLQNYGSSATSDHLLHLILGKILEEIGKIPGQIELVPKLGLDLTHNIEIVAEALAQWRGGLLVFDNYESVLSISGERAGESVDSKLSKIIGKLRMTASVLITSREDPGEWAEVHRLEGLKPEAAVALVRETAEQRAKSLDEVAIGRIVKECWGIPKLLTTVVGLSDVPVETILGTDAEPGSVGSDAIEALYSDLFERSWSRLPPEEKATLMACVFFVGAAPIKALRHTAGLDRRFAEALQTLVKMSLLDHVSFSYSVHPLTQRLCMRKLADGEIPFADLERRFVDYFFETVRRAARSGGDEIASSIDNVMAAVRRAGATDVLRALLTDARDDINRVLWKEGYWQQRLEADGLILQIYLDDNNDAQAAKVYVEDIGFTYLRFEALEEAEKNIKDGLYLFEKLQDARGKALATRHLGKAALLKADYDWLRAGESAEKYFERANYLYDESRAIWMSTADDAARQVAIADLNLDYGRLFWLWGKKIAQGANIALSNGPRVDALYKQAMQVSQDAIEIFRTCDEPDRRRGIAKALGNIGNVRKSRAATLRDHGTWLDAELEFEKAQEAYDESLRLAREIKKVDEIAHAAWGLAEIHEVWAQHYPRSRAAQLEKALQLATLASQYYSRMATPRDAEVTTLLRDRIHAQVAAMASSANDADQMQRAERPRDQP
jgi:hypothetical protein